MKRAGLRIPVEARRSPRLRLLGAALLLVTASGCTTPAGRYGQARIMDFFDAVPINLSSGYGLAVSARATPYVGVGAGYTDVLCFGFDDGRFGPYWREEYRGVPLISSLRHQDKPEEGDRWPGGDPIERPLSSRYRANSYVFVPGLASDGGTWPPPLGGDDEWQWPHRSNWELLNVELDVMLLFAGINLQVSPLQALDFVAGLFTLDPAGDDPEWIFRSDLPEPDAVAAEEEPGS